MTRATRGRPVTTKAKAGPSYRLAEWLRQNMNDRLKITQTELSKKLGYDQQTMVSMMKAGTAKVPLDKVEPLAREMDVDVSFLMLLALEQHLPGKEHMLHRIFGRVVAESDFDFLQQFADVIPRTKRVYTIAQIEEVGRVLRAEGEATA